MTRRLYRNEQLPHQLARAARCALMPPPKRGTVKLERRPMTDKQILAARLAKRTATIKAKRRADPLYAKVCAWARLRKQVGNEKSASFKLGISEGKLRHYVMQAKAWGDV